MHNRLISALKRIFANDDDAIGSGKWASTTDPTGKFWGTAGAGGIFFANSTGRYLLAFRSAQVNEPHTWGVWGGALDKGETPDSAIRREIREETKYTGEYELFPIWVYQKGEFKYHNYIIMVDDEFEPKLCWETEDFGWFNRDNFPKPLHFGLKAVLPFLK